MSISAPEALRVTVTDRASMDRQLDTAVRTVQGAARSEERRGILVTRVGYRDFTVELSDAVPFGITRELQQW